MTTARGRSGLYSESRKTQNVSGRRHVTDGPTLREVHAAQLVKLTVKQ